LPSDRTSDSQERTLSSANQKTSQLDPWQFFLVISKGTTDPQDQQSATDAQNNGKKDDDQREPHNLIYSWAVSHARIPEFRHDNQARQTK
jgi:hypothetical protein